MAPTSHGSFVWYDHVTRDAKAAAEFYGHVAGWKTQPFGNEGYAMWVGSQGPLGGVMELAKIDPHWMGHIQVADLKATLERLRQLGGQVCHDAAPVPEVGSFAIVTDPQGAAFSLFQPLSAMDAHDACKSGEICWRELLTPNSEAALDFYSQLVGWKSLRTLEIGPGATYRVFGLDEHIGGMMTVPNQPAQWLFYVQTDNLNAALERATQRGATVLNGPMDIPGGARIVQLKDPQGAVFALHEMPKT